MSLLVLNNNSQLMEVTQKIFNKQFEKDIKLKEELSERRKRLMMQDIYYNIDALDSAVKNDSDNIMNDYTTWLMGLLAYRMKDLGTQRVKEHMRMHFEILKETLLEVVDDENYVKKASVYIDNSINIIDEFQLKEVDFTDESKYKDIAEAYINSLLVRDKRKSSSIILDSVKTGTSIEDIYIEVFNPVMKEIGSLWYKGDITVDKEHYATAITQGVMSQLYSRIFSTPRNDKTMVALCVGNELHEMGIRMLCDLFELKGWDTIYLGAAVPKESIMSTLEEYNPQLLLLSVTMPNYLQDCKNIIESVRDKDKDHQIKIAVGGRAFDSAQNLRKKWELDTTASTFEELIDWSENNI
ncbi:MAG: cobalamin-dependent protein [Bacillota bacterium]|nr:cobalamin-dependent protein [Bacillota bacterium]